MTTRDTMHRCNICKQLFRDEECIMTEYNGLICPNKCEPVFKQSEYELPTND